VRLIVRREHQGDRAFARRGAKLFDKVLPVAQLRAIASAKFLLALGLVTEPVPQLGARRDVLHPHIDRGIRFFDAARPQPVDQDAGAVRGGWRLIGVSI
jgi:hypothetical protein